MNDDIISNFQTYDFQSNKIRLIIIDNEPWFVAKDVSDVLDYSDSQAMTRRLDKSELKSYTDTSSGQGRKIKIISEAGLYMAILGSQKPIAKSFQKWVTKDILPSIRKTGSYSISQDSTIPKSEIQELTEYSKQAFELLNLVQAQDSLSLHRFAKLFEKQDKKSPLELFDINLDNQFFIPTELGKMVGKTPIEINKILEFQGLQFSDNGVWKLTEKGQKVGIEIFGRFFQLKWKIAVLDNI